MQTLNDCESFYQTHLLPALEPLEDERRDLAAKLMIWYVLIGGAAAILVIVILTLSWHGSGSHRGEGKLLGAIVAGAITACAAITKSMTRKYREEFKDKIIAEIIRFYNPDLAYHPDLAMDQIVYDQSWLFRHSVDKYEGDDFVSGPVSGVGISFSELWTQYVTGSGKNRTWHTIFRGMFFVGDFNKSFQGQTFILPASKFHQPGMLGQLFHAGTDSEYGQLIQLEDPAFNKLFTVYSNDQIEARYILSTSLMARIQEFTLKARRPVHLSFVNDKVYMGVCHEGPMLEPRLFTTLLSFAHIQEYFDDISLAVGIVNDLNLNQKIWQASRQAGA